MEKTNISFKEIEQDIFDALQKLPIELDEPTVILKGFLIGIFSKDINITSFSDADINIPIIVLVGENTHRLYFYSLKMILPHLKYYNGPTANKL